MEGWYVHGVCSSTRVGVPSVSGGSGTGFFGDSFEFGGRNRDINSSFVTFLRFCGVSIPVLNNQPTCSSSTAKSSVDGAGPGAENTRFGETSRLSREALFDEDEDGSAEPLDRLISLARPIDGGFELFLAMPPERALVGEPPSHPSNPAARLRFLPVVVECLLGVLSFITLAAFSTSPSHLANVSNNIAWSGTGGSSRLTSITSKISVSMIQW